MAKSGMEESDMDGNSEQDKSTEQQDKSTEQQENIETKMTTDLVPKGMKLSTQVSILIASLIEKLCSIYKSDPEKKTELYHLICERLLAMNLIDESYRMVEFEGMRTAYQQAFQRIIGSAGESENAVCSRLEWPTTDKVNSHYYQEFDEIEYIAGGGFGRVYKVKHKLDGTEYAVKKISIRAEGIEAMRSYLTEVKTFASVNHSNIVQYKAAWLELGPFNGSSSNEDTDSLTEDTTTGTHIDDEYIYHVQRPSFSNDSKDEDNSDFEVHFGHSVDNVTNHSVKRKSLRSSISEGGSTISKLDMKEIRELGIQHRAKVKWATLYIQMALCQSTLKQWLEKRNDTQDGALLPVGHARSETIYEVTKQLLEGLEYIHSKKIVHHDIKPSNIFIQKENDNFLVQLGDFGLACPLQNARHSLAFGTKMYAAPEQLDGKCDPKSDMYSLGIVLFELVEKFRTDMERVQYIENLRKGILPEHVYVQHPQLASMIKQLMCKDPQKRPNATTLLATVKHTSDSNYVKELEFKLAERDKEIAKLKEKLKSAGVKSI